VHEAVKKVHVYLGLLNASFLLVFGIAGLEATASQGGPRDTAPTEPVRFVAYAPPPGLGDKEIADDVYARLGPPLAAPVPKFAVKRDARNDLTFAFYTPNGVTNVAVLEKEARLRVEVRRAGFFRFINNLHATTIGSRSPHPAIRLWTLYNEVALWSLIAMVVTGAYLGLAARRRALMAAGALGLGAAAFVALYVATR
jgi:hypothetical protein